MDSHRFQHYVPMWHRDKAKLQDFIPGNAARISSCSQYSSFFLSQSWGSLEKYFRCHALWISHSLHIDLFLNSLFFSFFSFATRQTPWFFFLWSLHPGQGYTSTQWFRLMSYAARFCLVKLTPHHLLDLIYLLQGQCLKQKRFSF